MATSGADKPPTNGETNSRSVSRKYKATDLPLPSATRSAIDDLAVSFKKHGAYDAIRKQVWEKFEASVRNLFCLIGSLQILT